MLLFVFFSLPFLSPFGGAGGSGWGSAAYSQTATIRGFVYDKKTHEPAIFTNVYLKGTTHGAATDVNGYYAISKVPPGDYILIVTFIGFDTLAEPITVREGQILNKQLFVQKRAVTLDVVEISSEKQEAQSEVKISIQKITPKEIKQLPAIGGEADIAQYLQVLPGVTFTGDQGGQLYIRGGSPVQNKVLLDGMIIYNPFHSIGLFSVFDTDIIRNADIHTGGFNADQGGRISSIMDITTRDGNKKRYSGRIGTNTFGSRVLIEGPVFKADESSASSASFVFSAKTSYLQQSSKVLYPYRFNYDETEKKAKLIRDDRGLPFQFNDFYGKLSFNTSNGSKISLFGFNFSDRVQWQYISDLQWKSWGAGSKFVLVPEKTPVLIEGNFAYSRYAITLAEGELSPRSSAINGFNMGLDFTYFIGDDEIKYGVSAVGFETDFKFFNSINRKIEQNDFTTELSGYVKYRYKKNRFVAEPGFRMQYYASFPTLSPEPRLGFKYNVTDNIRLKLATGLYSQNLISANSDRDVVNLFYGFLSGPDNLQKTFTEKDGTVQPINHKLQKAVHAIVGAEFDITSKLKLNVEAYRKWFTQLTNLNRNKLFDDSDENRPDAQKKDFIVETGDAYGTDYVLKYEYKRTYFWVVYSLMWVKRWDGLIEYYPVFDKRHNINLLANYTFGKNLNWELSGRWNFGSGFPFTQTQGFYGHHSFSNGTNSDYVRENPELFISYANINEGRLPYYHRFDLSLKHIIAVSANSIIEINAGVTNLYNRSNIFYIDRVSYSRIYQLPVLPTLGALWTF